ncbi:MAG TPA: M14 family zinc carboxypeptidase, partial [Gemmatimonadaceae bacterium]|nr:M14 family zinc carboxypeptidase [Gemmatimonadaceae bacterium]
MLRAGLVAAATFAAAAPLSAQHAFDPQGTFDPRVPTPQSVLGYEVGARFTPHHKVHQYFEALARTSDRVRLDTLGRTYEGREVLLLIVSSPDNMRRLDAVRRDAEALASPDRTAAAEIDAIVQRAPAIAWLGYTVHGNEASGTEAALATAYQLAAGTDAATRLLLDSVVTLIDPIQNPDGHERHAQDVMRARSAWGIPSTPGALAQQGNWPGARTSHYHFDLNRDWFIHSHPETRARVSGFFAW